MYKFEFVPFTGQKGNGHVSHRVRRRARRHDDDDFFDPNLLQVRVESRASSPSLPGPSGLDKPVRPALNQPSAEALAEFPPAMRRIEPPRPPRGMPWGTYKAPLQEVTLTGAESLLPHHLSQLGLGLSTTPSG